MLDNDKKKHIKKRGSVKTKYIVVIFSQADTYHIFNYG